MICPELEAALLSHGWLYSHREVAECRKENCAKYDKDKKQCAILTIAKALDKPQINVRVAK